MDLVIIEGIGKKETIQKYLGQGYEVFPTMGHIRDLPEKSISIDIENNFEPTYEIMPDKDKIVENMKKKAKKANKVYIATDPDREGEAIAWHVAIILGFNKDDKCRVAFNEISKKAINEAMKEPRTIDQNLVDAQQARRVLDRLVGYTISPILWRGIEKNLSAGRVQSVALKIITEREKEISEFKPEEYWPVSAKFNVDSTEFKAQLQGYNGKKIVLHTAEKVEGLKNYLKSCKFQVMDIKRKESLSKAPPPFITSTMQQDAINKLKFKLEEVTKIAQTLYEGVDIKGNGKQALITYIRTDSTRVSDDAKFKARDFIQKNYGSDYAPKSFNVYKTKSDAQDAHEAIRPISIDVTPESIKANIDEKYYKLYKLIYERFLASQMSEARYDSVSVDIDAVGPNGNMNFKTTGRTLKFAGYTKIYKEVEDSNSDLEAKIPPMKEGQILNMEELICEQKFTKPPARYSEATLIKQLEDNGVGRPATYASIVKVIFDRQYVENKGKTKFIIPTDLGIRVNDFLAKHFEKLIDVNFTANFEKKLDKVAEGQDKWKDTIGEFYKELDPLVEEAKKEVHFTHAEPIKTKEICDKCGRYMNLIDGKYGKFLSCSGYPECTNRRPYVIKIATCPKCGGVVAEKKTKTNKIFYGCMNYPNCDYTVWDKPTDVRCPRCNGMILERKDFYSCENYDTCKFSTKFRPLKERCQKCGGMLVEKYTETETIKECINCKNKEIIEE